MATDNEFELTTWITEAQAVALAGFVQSILDAGTDAPSVKLTITPSHQHRTRDALNRLADALAAARIN